MLKGRQLAMAVAAGLLLTCSAWAEVFDDIASANWALTGTWSSTITAYPGDTNGRADTANIDSNQVRTSTALDLATLPGAGSLTINVLPGGELRVDISQAFNGLNLSGGRLGWLYHSGSDYWSGSINLTADSFVGGSTNTANDLVISGAITGAGKLTVDSTGSSLTAGSGVELTNTANNWTGGTRVLSGWLYANGANAINHPLQPVVVDAGFSGTSQGLLLSADQNVSKYVINSTGVMAAGYSPTISDDIEMNGGVLMGNGWGGFPSAAYGMVTYSGNISVQTRSYLGGGGNTSYPNNAFTLSGNISGSSRLVRCIGSSALVINPTTGTNNGFSGGFDLWAGRNLIQKAGALGDGSLTVGYGSLRYDMYATARLGATLETGAAGVLDSPSSITVKAEGDLVFGSTETRTGIVLQPGGAFQHSGGTTAYTYGAGNRFLLHRGAIIHSSASVTAPTRAEMLAADTSMDSGFGFYQGITGSVNAKSYGDDGGTNSVFRGPAAMAYQSAAIINDNLTDVGGAGIFAYAQSGGTLQINLAAGKTINTGKLTVNGGGTFTISGAANNAGLPAVIDSYAGLTTVASAGGLPGGKTLNVKGGAIKLDANDAIADGATLNIGGSEAALTLFSSRAPSTGTIVIQDGGAVWTNSEANLTSQISYQSGSQIVTTDYSWAAAIPGDGVPSILMEGGNTFTFSAGDVLLGDNSRLSIGWTRARTDFETIVPVSRASVTVASASYKLVLGTDMTSGRVAAPDGSTLKLTIPVYFPGANDTLIVGDDQTFRALNADATDANNIRVNVFTDLTQGGTVTLENDTNQIGKIDVDGGTLFVDAVGRLGGAAAIHLNKNTTLALDLNNPTLTGVQLTGSGKVLPGNNAGATGNMLALDGGSISPGSSAGVFTVDGDLDVQSTNPFALNVEVVGGSLTPGVGFDQLVVDGALTGIENIALVVDLKGLSGIGAGDKLYILTTTSDLTGLSFKSVSGYNPANVEYGNGYVALTNVPEPATMGLLAFGFLPLVLRRRRR